MEHLDVIQDLNFWFFLLGENPWDGRGVCVCVQKHRDKLGIWKVLMRISTKVRPNQGKKYWRVAGKPGRCRCLWPASYLSASEISPTEQCRLGLQVTTLQQQQWPMIDGGSSSSPRGLDQSLSTKILRVGSKPPTTLRYQLKISFEYKPFYTHANYYYYLINNKKIHI